MVCVPLPSDTFDVITNNIASILLFTAAGMALIFIILYQLLAQWEKNPFGIHTMSANVVLFLVLTLGVGAAIFGMNYPGRQLLRSLIFFGAVVVIGQQIYLLLREQLGHRNQLPPPTKKADGSDDSTR